MHRHARRRFPDRGSFTATGSFLFLLLLVLGSSACASSAGGRATVRPRGPISPCQGYAELQAARLPDGRPVLQAFDSVYRAAQPTPARAGSAQRNPAIDSITNTRVLRLPITFAPTLSPEARLRTAKLLEQTYPPLLRNRGIEGDLELMIFMDAHGHVVETRLVRSSGYSEMDLAASTVARGASPFLPALAGDCSVPYVFQLPIRYRVASSAP